MLTKDDIQKMKELATTGSEREVLQAALLVLLDILEVLRRAK